MLYRHYLKLKIAESIKDPSDDSCRETNALTTPLTLIWTWGIITNYSNKQRESKVFENLPAPPTQGKTQRAEHEETVPCRSQMVSTDEEAEFL